MAPTFRQLQYFVVLAETLNFSRAARRLNISQPPLSASIRQLEEELEVRLFDRDTKKVELTPAGVAFQARARILLANLDESIAAARRAKAQKRIELSIGFVPSMLFRRLPEFVREFEALYPHARVMLKEMNSTTQIEAVMCGHIDVGFVHDAPLPEGVESLLIKSEPLVCCVPSSHRLAQSPFVNPRELDGERIVTFKRALAPNFADRILDLLARTGAQPNLAYEVNHWISGLAMVAQGMAIAVVAQSMVQFAVPNVTYIPFDQDYGHHESRCIWLHTREDEAPRLLVDTVSRCLRAAP